MVSFPWNLPSRDDDPNQTIYDFPKDEIQQVPGIPLLNAKFDEHIKELSSFSAEFNDWIAKSYNELRREELASAYPPPYPIEYSEYRKAMIMELQSQEPPIHPKIDKSMFVEKTYTLDKATEDMLPYGSHLENGFEVLIASDEIKADLKKIDEDSSERHKALKYNRWAIVTHLRISDGFIYFTALYRDGMKMQIDISGNYAWIVKKDSLPESKRKRNSGEWVDDAGPKK